MKIRRQANVTQWIVKDKLHAKWSPEVASELKVDFPYLVSSFLDTISKLLYQTISRDIVRSLIEDREFALVFVSVSLHHTCRDPIRFHDRPCLLSSQSTQTAAPSALPSTASATQPAQSSSSSSSPSAPAAKKQRTSTGSTKRGISPITIDDDDEEASSASAAAGFRALSAQLSLTNSYMRTLSADMKSLLGVAELAIKLQKKSQSASLTAAIARHAGAGAANKASDSDDDDQEHR